MRASPADSLIFLSFSLGGAGSYLGGGQSLAVQAEEGMAAMVAAGRKLSIATWNIAAINNNPFEYWITIEDNPKYEQLMVNVEKFLDSPKDKDVPVKDVFTEEMFSELDKRLTGVGWTSVRSYWESDFMNRKIVTEFMKVSVEV